eukprot:CAMPEP_0119322680 /NCGR_PEP_ID=MMETSP1333-20130426/58880_1 /TAXON_ID=418940 /ORGANISM="Scyphosphaera apsteinii, Strain RCC1455" /LENGTH=48 /DNA_ID= /DNA_START= /DNA_END= /DNA_ORIENTATION=
MTTPTPEQHSAFGSLSKGATESSSSALLQPEDASPKVVTTREIAVLAS